MRDISTVGRVVEVDKIPIPLNDFKLAYMQSRDMFTQIKEKIMSISFFKLILLLIEYDHLRQSCICLNHFIMVS